MHVIEYEPLARFWSRHGKIKSDLKRWKTLVSPLNLPPEVRNARSVLEIGHFLMLVTGRISQPENPLHQWCLDNVEGYGSATANLPKN